MPTAEDDIRALEALRPGRGPGAPPPATEPTAIQARWFRPRRGGNVAFVSAPLDVAGLPRPQRRILELLCADDYGESWGHRGLPPDIRSRRRLLGLDPPGVLEELAACAALGKGKHPRWRVLRVALDDYRRKHANDPERPPLQAWIAERFFDASPVVWLELWTEVKARSYHLSTGGDPLAAAAAAVSKADRAAWARRWAAEIERSPERNLRHWVGAAIVAALESHGVAAPAKLVRSLALRDAPPRAATRAPAPAVARGVYRFSGKKRFGLADVEQLDAASRRQFLLAAKKYGGKAFATPRAFFAREAKEQGTTIDGVGVVRWTIAPAAPRSEPRWEMWVFLVDNGTVFERGTATLAGIAMFQGRFVAEDARGRVVKPGAAPSLERFARELQASLPRSLA